MSSNLVEQRQKLLRLRQLKLAEQRQQALRYQKWVNDPVGFVYNELYESPWSLQRTILQSVNDNRHTAVQSCHAAGKSFIASRAAMWWTVAHPPGETFVVTTAPSFPQIRAVLWREIHKAHREHGLPGKLNQTEWLLDDQLVAFGRKPADTDATGFQGIHAPYVLVVIDEAAGVPGNLWEAIESLLTNVDARVLAIGNPTDPSSQFAQVCKPGSGWNRIKISAFDTPAFTGEKVPRNVARGLVSREWVADREREGTDTPNWQARVLAEFPDTATNSLLNLAWIEVSAATTLFPEPSAKRTLGVDVARFGHDRTVIYLKNDMRIRKVDEFSGADTMQTSGRVIAAAQSTSAEAIHVDSIGVGAGVVDRLAELGWPVFGIDVGAGPSDAGKRQFLNYRAEAYWGLRRRFETHEIDIDRKDLDLQAEAAAIRYEYTSDGKVKIESKDDMRERGVRSPDHLDAVMLACAAPQRARKRVLRVR